MTIHILTVNNKAFKCQFVAKSYVWLRSIWGYNIDNTQGRWIYNKGQLKAIAHAQYCMWLMNNVQHRSIRMHRKRTGTQRNAWECTGTHRSAQERLIMSDKFHSERPINTQMRVHWTSAVGVADVFFWCSLCGYCLNKNSTPKFLTHN